MATEEKVILTVQTNGLDNINEIRGSISKLRQEVNSAEIDSEEWKKASAELNKQQDILNQTLKISKSQTSGVDDSYKALNARLVALREAYRQLSAEQRESADVGQKYLAEIAQLDEELKGIDAGMGQFYRNVGNYSSAFKGLTLNVQQVARELPSLTMGANQFFLAISNNVPMLVDSVKQFRESGNTWAQTIGAIGKSLFSWTTLITIIITLLSAFGGEIIEWVKNLFSAKDASDAVSESLDKMRSAMTKETEEVKSLFASLRNAKQGTVEYATARQTILDKYGQYLQNQREDIANLKDLAAAEKVVSDAIRSKALARAYEQQIEEATTKYAEDVNKVLEGVFDKFMDRFGDQGEEVAKEYYIKFLKGVKSQDPALQAESKRIAEMFEVGKGYYKVGGVSRKIGEAYQEYQETLQGYAMAQEILAAEYGISAQTFENAGKKVAKTSIEVQDVLLKVAKTTNKIDTSGIKDWIKEEEERNNVAKKRYEQELSNIEKSATAKAQWNSILIEDDRKRAEEEYNLSILTLERKKAVYEQMAKDESLALNDMVSAELKVADIEVEIEQEKYARMKELREQDIADQKQKREQSLAIAQASLSGMSSILGSIADIYENNGKEDAKAQAKAKNLRIAGATMDMLSGIVAAVSQAMTLGPIVGPIMGALNSAIVTAAGIANIQKIRNTDTSGNSAPSAVPTNTLVSAPAIIQQIPVTRSLTGASEEERLNQIATNTGKDQRVVLVYSDVEAAGRRVQVQQDETSF